MGKEDGYNPKYQTHKSWATLSFNRKTYSYFGNPKEYSRQLFASSIENHQVVSLEIHTAKLNTDYGRDTIFSDKLLIDVELSINQFAEAITSLNHEAVPCTLRWFNGEQMPDPPARSKRIEYDEKFKVEMEEVVNSNNKFLERIDAILSKPKYGKEDKAEIKKELNMMLAAISDRVPFLKKMFSEQMDETVVEAKSEFNEWLDAKLRSVGLQDFKKELLQVKAQKALESKEWCDHELKCASLPTHLERVKREQHGESMA